LFLSRIKHILFLVAFFGSVSPVIAQDDQFALVVHRSPDYGGYVTPLPGVNMSGQYQLVEISATPRKGYQFVYWLGDVTDPAKRNTTVLIDSPKMVVAVFERAELVVLAASGISGIGGSGGGTTDLTSSSSIVSSMGSTAGGSSGGSPQTSEPQYPGGGGGGGEPEVPEPATIAMLGTGVLLIRRRKRR
jgi:hypothetical protein